MKHEAVQTESGPHRVDKRVQETIARSGRELSTAAMTVILRILPASESLEQPDRSVAVASIKRVMSLVDIARSHK